MPAERCDEGAVPWLAVAFEGAFTPSFRQQALRQLASGLARQNLKACGAGARDDAPLATVTLSSSDALATVTITVDDEVTDKKVSRPLEVSSLSESARALAFAVAAEELVRASWAELVLERQPPVPRDVPPPEAVAVVERKLVSRLQPPRGTTHVLTAFSFDYFPGTGMPWLGLELGLRQNGTLLRSSLTLQAHSSGGRENEGGSIRLAAGGAQADTAVVLRWGSAVRVSIGPSVEVLLVHATSDAKAGFRGTKVTDFVVIPRIVTGVELDASSSGLYLGLRAAAGHTVRGLALQAAGDTTSGPAGMVVGAAFTVGATL